MRVAQQPLQRAGSARYSARSTRGVIARSGCGMIHGGVRWKTVQLARPPAGSAARTGSPTRRCRSPRRARPRGRGRGPIARSGRSSPSKRSSPASSGIDGSLRRADAGDEDVGRRSAPLEVSTCQRCASSSQRGRATSRLEAHVRRTPKSVGAALQVGARSPAAARTRGSSRGSARTRTSRGATGTSHWQPGYVLSRQVPPTSSRALEHDEVVDAHAA